MLSFVDEIKGWHCCEPWFPGTHPKFAEWALACRQDIKKNVCSDDVNPVFLDWYQIKKGSKDPDWECLKPWKGCPWYQDLEHNYNPVYLCKWNDAVMNAYEMDPLHS